jgi:HSP20 family molecular chaperone IbpA
MADVVKSIEVECPLRTVYNQWTQFEEFPRFMEGIKEVKQLDPAHLRWHANIGGKDLSWEAEITEQLPDERISWRSTTGAANAGTVRFDRLPSNRTRVTLAIHYDPEGVVENVGDALGLTSHRIEGDLKRFKDFIENRGAETGQWRGEVHHGQFAQHAGAAGEGTQAGRPDAQRAGVAGERSRAGRLTRVPRRPFPSLFASRWDDPFGRMRMLTEEFDRFAESFMGSRNFGGRAAGDMGNLWRPQIEVARRGDEIVISTDLPGTRKEDVHVNIEDDRIVIEGERRCESGQDERVHRSECNYGQFYREVSLPEGVDASTARASLRDGVLTVRVRGSQARQAKRIEIEDANAPAANASSETAPDQRAAANERRVAV